MTSGDVSISPWQIPMKQGCLRTALSSIASRHCGRLGAKLDFLLRLVFAVKFPIRHGDYCLSTIPSTFVDSPSARL
jgi:hypothetical protein